ncbi:MAG: hypothetical protein N2259_00930 [Patescibacteria group bacterium]|nr:hypothetical protein [Patescibacteria group bacterium]
MIPVFLKIFSFFYFPSCRYHAHVQPRSVEKKKSCESQRLYGYRDNIFYYTAISHPPQIVGKFNLLFNFAAWTYYTYLALILLYAIPLTAIGLPKITFRPIEAVCITLVGLLGLILFWLNKAEVEVKVKNK